MAILKLSTGLLLTTADAIGLELASLRVVLRSEALVLDDDQRLLLTEDIWDEPAKQHFLAQPQLAAMAAHCTDAGSPAQPLWWDLLNLHPGSAQLHLLMSAYDRYHIHTAPEAFYVLSGSAIVGFVRSDGMQMQLLVQPQEYLYIPAEVEHWFSPGPDLSLKAVRYFVNVEGWVPQYTGTSVSDAR